jgi:hypothetical protein
VDSNDALKAFGAVCTFLQRVDTEACLNAAS